MLSSTKASELSDYYRQFLNSAGKEKIVKLVLALYSLIEQYPWENPLKEITKEDYIGTMVVALWSLRVAINDANFVLAPTTASMFALGSQKAIKDSRINFTRQRLCLISISRHHMVLGTRKSLISSPAK